jgi:hypothetical protein
MAGRPDRGVSWASLLPCLLVGATWAPTARRTFAFSQAELLLFLHSRVPFRTQSFPEPIVVGIPNCGLRITSVTRVDKDLQISFNSQAGHTYRVRSGRWPSGHAPHRRPRQRRHRSSSSRHPPRPRSASAILPHPAGAVSGVVELPAKRTSCWRCTTGSFPATAEAPAFDR